MKSNFFRLKNREPDPLHMSTFERDKRTVFVKQLAQRLKKSQMLDLFKQAGRVRDARIVVDKNSRRSK